MLPQDIILKKRNGGILAPDEIHAFIADLSSGALSEGQIAAFAMAVWFIGMTRDEIVALTLSMRDSGDVLDWDFLGKPVTDKHSTGGVGDNVSLMLAPLVASCGVAVPMISGRGLGHTGGTLDKLESIPGYNIQPDAALFRATVKHAGCAIIGQTANLAPADRKLYAVRDVTATVDSLPLITASILSKKLAAGLQSLVLDVKIGNGSFMQAYDDAESLARTMVDVANGAGVRTTALITDMNEPLADAAGNALEIRHCLDFLTGRKKGTRIERVVLSFAAEMLVTAGVDPDLATARERAQRALDSGKALETFAKMVALLGGPADFIEKSDAYLPVAPVILPVLAEHDGMLASVQTRDIGMGVIGLGGGRRRPDDGIDHAVGFADLVPLGTFVERGDQLATVHARNQAEAEAGRALILQSYTLSNDLPNLPPVIVSRIS